MMIGVCHPHFEVLGLRSIWRWSNGFVQSVLKRWPLAGRVAHSVDACHPAVTGAIVVRSAEQADGVMRAGMLPK